MRRAGKVDLTQSEIVKALRGIGASVAVTSSIGKGFPDLVVGFRSSVNVLLEVKTGERPCDRKLTAAEEEFHEKWSGPIAVVSTGEEAVNAVLVQARLAGAI